MNHETPYFNISDVHVSAYEVLDPDWRNFRLYQALGYYQAMIRFSPSYEYGAVFPEHIPWSQFPLEAIHDHKGTLMCKWGAHPSMQALCCIEAAWAAQGEYSLDHFITPKEGESGLIEHMWDQEGVPITTFVNQNGNITNLDDFRK